MRRSRRRWWRVLLLALLALGGVVALLPLALRTELVREQIRGQINLALGSLFTGELRVDRLGQVGLWGVEGVDARVFDASGRQVIRVQGLSARASLLGLAWQLLSGSSAPAIRIERAHVDHADVTLREDEEWGVSLAEAFFPRETDAPSSEPGMQPSVYIERAELAQVWAHGRAGGSPPLDVELRGVSASLQQVTGAGFQLELRQTDLVTRGLPLEIDPRGRLTGSIEVPDDDALPLRLEGTLAGRAAGSPLYLEATWRGDELAARLRMLAVPAAHLNRQVEGLTLDGDLALAVDVDGQLPELALDAEIDGSAGHVRVAGYAFLSGELEAGLELVASRIDVSRIARGAPPSELDLRGGLLLLERDAGRLSVAQRVEWERGSVAGEAVPPGWVNGQLAWDERAGARADGGLCVEEPGAFVTGDYRLDLPTRGARQLEISLASELRDPERLSRLGVQARGELTGRAKLNLDTERLSARLELSRGELEAGVLRARRLELVADASGSLDQPRVHAEGRSDVLSGSARAELDYSPERERLHVSVAEVDLLGLASSLGLKLPFEQATGAADLELQREGRNVGYRLSGDASADLGKVGSLQVSADRFELPRAPLRPERLAALRGALAMKGKLDLDELSPYYLARTDLPLERVGGRLRFELSAKQLASEPGGLELAAAVDTNGFSLVERRAGPELRPTQDKPETTGDAAAQQPWALEGIDLRLSVRAHPTPGDVVGTLLLRDRGGTLAEVQMAADLAGLWPRSLTSWEALRQAPLEATLQVPSRRLASLPTLLQRSPMRGRVALDATLVGSLANPRIDVAAQGQGLRSAGSKLPLDAQAKLHYTRDAGLFAATAQRTNGGVQVLDASVDWRGDLLRLPELASGQPVLNGSAKAKLTGFPLDVVPALAERQLLGQLNGELYLKDWGKDATLDARLATSQLKIGSLGMDRLELTAHSDAERLRAELVLASGGGTANASLEASMRWGSRALPELQKRGVAKLSARDFQLESLSPLIAAHVSELAGVLDGDSEVAVSPEATTVKGQLKLERGVVQLPAIGQRFSDIKARVVVSNNQFELTSLEARGITGRVSVTGNATLDGFALRSARAHAHVAERERLPVTLEGAAIGDAWGDVNWTFASPPEGEQQMLVDVQRLHLETPEASSQSLQSLDAPEDIRVGVRRADGKFVALPVQPLDPGASDGSEPAPPRPLRIRVKLGNVTVEKGRTAKVEIRGELTALVAAKTELVGRLELRGGKLDVQGKTFEIERGVITFDGQDPGNPTITATARWDAPEYTVYAEYVGDVKSGRIKLRTEPPLTQDEIASLLLFGSPEGSAGGSDPNAAALAVSVAGDTATRGLNQALDDFTNLDVSTRIDTSTGSARPELVFQVSPRVAAKVTRAIGSPAAGESPDRTFLTLELRLRQAWSLSALLGDHGASALDLIWRRRY